MPASMTGAATGRGDIITTWFTGSGGYAGLSYCELHSPSAVAACSGSRRAAVDTEPS